MKKKEQIIWYRIVKFENPTHVAPSKYESTENQLENRHLSEEKETQQLMNIVIT